jgi:hypothetical protein
VIDLFQIGIKWILQEFVTPFWKPDIEGKKKNAMTYLSNDVTSTISSCGVSCSQT